MPGIEKEDDVIIISSDSENERDLTCEEVVDLSDGPSCSNQTPTSGRTCGVAIKNIKNATGTGTGPGPNSSKSIECIELNDDSETDLPVPIPKTVLTSSSTSAETIKEDAREDLERFVYTLKMCMDLKEQLKVKNQLLKAFEKADFGSVKAGRKIKGFVEEILKESTKDPKSSVKLIPELLRFLKSRGGRGEGEDELPETPDEGAAREEGERIISLEEELGKVVKKIQGFDEEEVDLSDENSAYLQRNRWIEKCMKEYKKICVELGYDSTLTGRPVQKRIKLKGITKCEELDEAIEGFVNRSRVELLVPDFLEIKKLVSEFNAQACPPPFGDSEIEPTSMELFREIMRIIRNRRCQDMIENAFPAESILSDDPAERDEELRKKLEENDKLRRSEHEIIDAFLKKQEARKLVAKEVEEDPETSAGESDDEDEANASSDEHDDKESGFDEDVVEPQEVSGGEVQKESENIGSEDVEPPRKKQHCSE